MNIRVSTINDLPDIMNIIKDAQKLLASLNIDQWQDGYPNKNQILNDIKNNESYVLLDNEEQIIATFMLTTRKEPNYTVIKNGQWLTNNKTKYGVIHRIAVAQKTRNKGIAKHIISYCESFLKQEKITAMRIDTHSDNLGMQHILKTLNYTYCGVITVTTGASRLAYEKLLS